MINQKQKPCLFMAIIFFLVSCSPEPIDDCSEYLQNINGKEYLGSLRVCEDDMPQIEVSYPGYADLKFEEDIAIVRTYYEYVSTDTITTTYSWRLSQIESGTCHVLLEDINTDELKGFLNYTIIHLYINPGINCGESDSFVGNYL